MHYAAYLKAYMFGRETFSCRASWELRVLQNILQTIYMKESLVWRNEVSVNLFQSANPPPVTLPPLCPWELLLVAKSFEEFTHFQLGWCHQLSRANSPANGRVLPLTGKLGKWPDMACNPHPVSESIFLPAFPNGNGQCSFSKPYHVGTWVLLFQIEIYLVPSILSSKPCQWLTWPS